ncbi:MAG: DNA/RNA nuclease SfsA [Clostridia bacterium]|nr:DNA/RNA nuclease SfsA [Clostridia bacterium]
MRYNRVVKAVFVNRPNRFIANVTINGTNETVHVKNTGRCKELLTEGCIVYLAASDNQSRKTKYDLIAVDKKRGSLPPLLVNMDSQAVNVAAEEWLAECGLFSSSATIRREVTYGNSRFDFYVKDGDREAYVEVKGVTLENNGVALFPDAPTERGVKHINELIECVKNGYEAYILFVIQMKGVHCFKPNIITHEAFADALKKASLSGVNVVAVDCVVTPDSMKIDKYIVVDY